MRNKKINSVKINSPDFQVIVEIGEVFRVFKNYT